MERKHAVVIGASMAGLAVARVLTNHFESVTLIDRDSLDDAEQELSRKAIPQGNHAHALLASGLRILERNLPGITDGLVATGAPFCDAGADFLWHQFGAWKVRADVGLRGVLTTRPILEQTVRRRVRALPKVKVLDRHTVDDVLFADGRVTGVRIKSESGDEQKLDADFVVDASGRGSKTPQILEAWGYGGVEESAVPIDVGYVTAQYERRDGDLHASCGCVIASTPPASRGGVAFAVQRQRWQITFFGSLGDHPPLDASGLVEFAKGLPVPELFDLIRDRPPLTPIHQHKFPASRRRHYEKLARFPQGFLVVGDALCSFNPIYGQGMSVALQESDVLDELLKRNAPDLAKRFFTKAKVLIDAPWSIAVGEDFRYPKVEGKKPPGTWLIHPYMERVHHVAARDPVVFKRFLQVAHLAMPPTSILAPSIALRVLRG